MDFLGITKFGLSILLTLLSLVAFFSFFELFGKQDVPKDPEILKIIHRINGISFFFVFLAGSLLCIYLLSKSKIELSPRIAFHAFSGVSILIIFSLKMAFIKKYRNFYNYSKLLGILLIFFTFILFSFSAGYAIITVKDKDNNSQVTMAYNISYQKQGDPERGKTLFQKHCSKCHYVDKKDYIKAAPGLKGLFQEKLLPVSKKPVTPENIINQMKNPYMYMPSFNELSPEEMADIVSYVKTL